MLCQPWHCGPRLPLLHLRPVADDNQAVPEDPEEIEREEGGQRAKEEERGKEREGERQTRRQGERKGDKSQTQRETDREREKARF